MIRHRSPRIARFLLSSTSCVWYVYYSFAIVSWIALGLVTNGLAQGMPVGNGAAVGSVWNWDIASGRADRGSDPVPENALYSWSADGAVKAVAQGTSIRITNRDHGIVQVSIRSGYDYITALSLSPAGNELAVATTSGYLVVWKDLHGTPAFEKQISKASVSCLAFNASGEWLASGGDSINIWETRQWTAVRPTVKLSSPVTAIAFDRSDELAAGDFSGYLHLFHSESEETTEILTASGSVTALTYSPDGLLLAAGGADGVVKVWGMNRNAPVAVLTNDRRVLALSFHPNNTLLAIATDESQVSTWDIATHRRLRTLPLESHFAAGIGFASNDLLYIGLQGAPPTKVETLHSLVILGGAKSVGEDVNEAREEAVAVAGAIEKSGRGSFGRIDQRLLLEGGTDADRVRVTLQAIARDSLPGDSLFVYYASPGGQDTAQVSDSLIFANGGIIPLTHFARWLDNTAASEQMIVFDSADANAQQNTLRSILAGGVKRQGPKQQKRLFVAFDRKAGEANPSRSTAMLIDGLSGQADQYPKDGRVTAAELRTFLEQRSLSIAESGFKGRFELDGDDFDLVSQKSRGGIPAKRPGPPPSDLVFQKRHDYALLIATNDYDTWPQLTNPIQDAKDIKRELEEKYGFQVELLTDQTQPQIYDAFTRYQKKEYQPGDQLFIFIAGHGDFDEYAKEGFLVAKDSKLPSADTTRSSLIPHSRLRNYIDNIPVNHVLLIMDVCFGGTFDRKIADSSSARGGMYEDQPIDKLFVERAQYTTRTFLTSGGKVYVPDGEPGHNSPFVHSLLAELRNPSKDRGYLTFADLQSAIESTKPAPVWGTWGRNDPGSDFFLISRDVKPASRKSRTRDLPQPESVITQRPVVCFVGLKNLSGDLSASVLGDEITEMVTDGLGAGERLNVVPSQDVDTLKRSLPLENLSSYSRATLLQIRQNTHADTVIAGNFTPPREPGGMLIVSFTIQDAVKGEIVDTVLVPGTQAGLADLIRKANVTLLQKLGVSDLSPDQINKATEGMPKTAKAIEYYTEAMRNLHRGEAKAALDLLMKADAAEPAVAFIQAGLSDAWFQLGYDNNAIAAANLALSYGQGLSEQEAGAIRARASVLQGKLPEAIELYRALVMFNPDKLQFGLKLVETESKAGQGTRALEDIAMLEKLPSPLGDDPRIRIEQAHTYDSIGDYPQVAAAAQQAQAAAAAVGARMLEAQASLSLCWAQRNLGHSDNAVSFCQQAYDIYQRVGDKLGMARAEAGLGTALADKSDYAGALAKYQVSAGLTESIGARTDRGGALQNIAKMLIYLDRQAEAEAALEAMTALAKEVGDAKLETESYFFRADLAHTGGDMLKAQDYAAQALRLAQASSNQDATARAFSFQATYGLEAGGLSAALADAEKCIEIRTKNRMVSEIANCQQTLGDILLAENRLTDAQAAYGASAKIFADLKQPGDTAGVWIAEAEWNTEAGSPREGERLANDALQEFRKESDTDMQAFALSALLHAQIAQDKRSEADQTWNALTQLHPQDLDAQATVRIEEARYRALVGAFDVAQARAGEAMDSCKQRGRKNCELQARLLRDQIRSKSGQIDGLDTELKALAADASQLGFNLIAERAEKLRAPPPGERAHQ
jgi:WD40 repeat protein/TolB-like protein